MSIVVITNKNSALALDTSGAGTAQGTSAVQATPSTGSSRPWTLTAAGSGLYADHLWQLVPAGDGYYKIANCNSGLLLVGRQRHGRSPVEADVAARRAAGVSAWARDPPPQQAAHRLRTCGARTPPGALRRDP
ncbi:hypothetical protein ACWC1K_43655, partial [Streptomyces sp. NPDC001492]